MTNHLNGSTRISAASDVILAFNVLPKHTEVLPVRYKVTVIKSRQRANSEHYFESHVDAIEFIRFYTED